MATKRELKKLKDKLSYKIRNLKEDYKDVLPEDMPNDITQELKGLMNELRAARDELAEK